jgi:integrase
MPTDLTSDTNRTVARILPFPNSSTSTGRPTTLPERFKILDGKVTIYQRAGSRNWYAEYSIPGVGQRRVALKTDSLTEARERAECSYLNAKQRKGDGRTVRLWTFAAVAEKWCEHVESEIKAGRLPSHWDKEVRKVQRYWTPYLADKDITEIRKSDIRGYIGWRQNYWTTGPGRNAPTMTVMRGGIAVEVKAIEYVRDGKRLRRPAETSVSDNRIKNEHNAFRNVLKFAEEHGYLKELPQSPEFKQINNYRPDFTLGEFSSLLKVALERCHVEHHHIMVERFRLYCFIVAMAYSGMRVTEAMRLRWKDVMLTGEGEERDIRLRVHGKGHRGEFFPLLNVAEAFDHLWGLAEFLRDKPPNPDDWVFAHVDGTRIKSFKKGIAELLKAAGLLVNAEGKRRSASSFRHLYATQQILAGVNTYDLAKSMRTTQQMIERFYGHITPQHIKDRLRPEWKLPAAIMESPEATKLSLRPDPADSVQ